MADVNDNTLVSVRNLVDHKVVYIVPEEHRRVVFEGFQERKIPAKELRALNYTIGGADLIHNYLCIKNDELREEFNIPLDLIEYDWTIKDIQRVLTDLNSPIEELEDALDFAPTGIREMLVDYAVRWKIPDSNRRRVISKMTGVNVDKMIEFMEIAEEDAGQEEAPSQRRLNHTQSTQVGRRIQH